MYTLQTYFKNNIRQYAMVIALIAIMLLFQGITPNNTMFKPMNINNLILQNSYVLILAIGMLLVIVTGNIDLSVGSIVAFVGAVSAIFMVDMKFGVVETITLSLLVGALAGAFHGWFVAFVKIPAFIVTLAGMLIFRGLTMFILQGQTKAPFDKTYQSIAAGYLPGLNSPFMGMNTLALIVGLLAGFLIVVMIFLQRRKKGLAGLELTPLWLDIVRAIVLFLAINWLTVTLSLYNGLPVIFIILAGLIMVYTFISQRTIPGRHIYALGGNAKAALLSGVKTKWIQFWVFVNMGLLSAFAGIVVAGRINAAGPKAGDGYELDAIAACFIGGASASGGVGTVVGTIVGGLVMGVLNNGMSLMGVSVDLQKVIKGLVLLGAAWFDVYNKTRSKSR